MAAGDFGGEADLRSRGGDVDAGGEGGADAPDASGDLVAEDHAGGDALRFLPGDDAQVCAAQRRGLHGEEGVARPQGGKWAPVQGEGAG